MALTDGEKRTAVSQTATLKWMEEFSLYDSETAQYVRCFGMFEPPDLSGAAATETTIVIDNPEERLDKLAKKWLGDERLWWVIALYNNFDLYEEDLYRGLRVNIPDRQWVQDNVINRPAVQRVVM